MNINDTVLFTTVYPEGMKYLRDWYLSVKSQSTDNFDILIGCDRLSPEKAQQAMGGCIQAEWIIRKSDETPVQFRERAVEGLINKYSKIIFVDSDDVLCPDRIKTSQEFLENHDVYGCSMQVIDESGCVLPITFKFPGSLRLDALLFKNNVFGLTNTAYRSVILANCLPFPKNVVLLDWFIVTKAMLNGADLYFDEDVNMKYRQHSQNTARIVPPFTEEIILKSTELVTNHYDFLLTYVSEMDSSARKKLEIHKAKVNLFEDFIKCSEEDFKYYVDILNKLPTKHIWWSCVANEELEYLWMR